MEAVVEGGEGESEGEFALFRRLPSFLEIPINCLRALVLQRNNETDLEEIH